MAESIVQVNEGAGKKLHTFQRTIGANAVEDEVILHGEPYLATYGITPTATLSMATANDHLVQIMAGASLNVLVRRIRLYQVVAVTTAASSSFQLLRLTTAGTGGTALTPAPFDSTDAAAGATAMTLPTVKGTEGVVLAYTTCSMIQTAPAGGPGQSTLLVEWDFDRLRTKGLRIPAGATNGIALKHLTANAAGTVIFEAVISELNFT